MIIKVLFKVLLAKFLIIISLLHDPKAWKPNFVSISCDTLWVTV